METQEGPRKRKRSDAVTEDADATAASIPADLDAEPIVRDEIYYRENGTALFYMPQGNGSTQANTDEDPLILYDEVDDFRALCWIYTRLYPLPRDSSPEVCLQQNEIATADMQKLVSLYLIAHKYHFDCIDRAQLWPVIRPHYFETCSQHQLQSLLRIVSQEKDASTKDSFSELLQILWICRLHKSHESNSFAFEVAEERGLRTLALNLYLDLIKKMETDSERIEGSTAYIQKTDDLAPHRKLALYQGYWSLRRYWSEAKVTAFEKEFACSSSLGNWHDSWSTKIAVEHQLPIFLEAEIRKSVNESKVNASCAVQAIADMVDELKTTLADHFLGPRPNDDD
ncbi:hypothetical protein BJ912DRAFT_978611 [Pholiota molesta]|nr:hypothetical protein BJ912DRAFT_978611 [Pholiota molesta]